MQGEEGRRFEAQTLELSKCNAVAEDWSPDTEGLKRDVKGAAVVFHFASTSD